MSQLSSRVVAAGAAALVAACGGSSSSGPTASISGLSAPSQMQVVTVDEGSALTAPVAPAVSNFPASSDYALDESFEHVFDPSMQAIQEVNSILCYVSQVAGDAMVNKGAYVAQIDSAKCDNGQDDSGSSQGQSSSSNAQQNEFWIVESTRASNDVPQMVDIWVPSEDNGHTGTIQVRMEIEEGPSVANPFGDFSMDFAMVTQTNPIDDPFFFGTLGTLPSSSGSRGFTFYNSRGDLTQLPPLGEDAGVTAVVVEMSSDETTGSARVSTSYRRNDPFGGDTGVITNEYQLAFDADDVLRGLDAGVPDCMSRTDYHVNTWRYNLYDATTGERIELNSGFPFETANGDHGWLGYWGLWVPDGVTVDDGDTITQVEYGSDVTTDYTVVKAPGKLMRHTRNTLELVEAEGETFEFYDFQLQPPTRFRVTVDTGSFYKVASWDDSSMTWTDLPQPELIDTASYGFLGMWSQSLGGQVNYVHGDSFLTYFEETFVNGADAIFATAVNGVVELYGFNQCLRSGLNALEVESGDVYLAPVQNVAQPYVFQFGEDDLTLMHDVNGDGSSLTQVGLLDGEEPQFGPFSWGMRSGPMVTDTSSMTSPFDIYSQAVFYTYETGHNSWNQYTAAIDMNGDPVTFDAPLQFTYTHTTAADANDDPTYDDKRYLLGYGGPGSLWGIPHTGIDFDGDGFDDRFVPMFSIVDGTAMGPNGDEYVIRAIDSELALQSNAGGCAALDLATAAALTLPDGSSFEAPDIGAAPTVTDAPAVIYGEVQGTLADN